MRTRMVYRYVHRPARADGQGVARDAARPRAREPGDGRRGDARGRRPRRGLRRHRRDRGLRGARRVGRPLRDVARSAPTSSRSSSSGSPTAGADAVADAVQRRRPAQHPARPEHGQPAGRRRRCPTRSRRCASSGVPFDADVGLAPGRRRPGRAADPARWRHRRRGRQRQRARLALGRGQHRQVPPDHLRLLAHPGHLVPGRRRGRRADDPHLRPVRGPALALVARPDPAVLPGALGAVPLDPGRRTAACASRRTSSPVVDLNVGRACRDPWMDLDRLGRRWVTAPPTSLGNWCRASGRRPDLP